MLDIDAISVKPREMQITLEQMKAYRIPRKYRDYCAHLWVPLQYCRRTHYYAPWQCKSERHQYEECQYIEYVRRMKIAKLIKQAQEKERNKALG